MKLLRVEPKPRSGDYAYVWLILEDSGKEFKKWVSYGGVTQTLGIDKKKSVMYGATKVMLEARRDAAVERGEDPKGIKASDPEQYELAAQFAAMWPEIDAALR